MRESKFFVKYFAINLTMSKRRSDDNQSEQSSNQKPSCGANPSNKRQRFTVEQARPETQTYQSAAKLCTGANPVRYICVLAPETKIVSKPTIQKFSTGDRLCFAINKKVCLCFVIIKNVCLCKNFTFEVKSMAFENLDKNCCGSSGSKG